MANIGRYRIVSELGRGAMGVVYRARDPKLGRELAVKTIRLKDHANPEEIGSLRKRLVREAQSAGRLAHPGIVTVFDVGEEDGVAYFTMELVEGQKLSDYRAADLEFGTKLQFLSDLLSMAGSALDYAHAHGVVHRDVKPANIMVTQTGVKIMDFGVARMRSSELTVTGTVVGSPSYMSPEQVQGESLDGRSDQFSLGIVAYEIVAGVKPFRSPNLTTTMFKLVNADPSPIRDLDARVPLGLERVVMQALEKNPRDRHESCSAFAAAFAAAAKLEAPSTPPRMPETAEPSRSLPEPQSRPAPGPRKSGIRIRRKIVEPDDDSTVTVLEPDGSVRRTAPADREGLPPVSTGAAGPLEDPDGERASQWPLAIFILLLCAIGALSLLLVRYPGLLEDPAELLDLLLGRSQTENFEPAPASLHAFRGQVFLGRGLPSRADDAWASSEGTASHALAPHAPATALRREKRRRDGSRSSQPVQHFGPKAPTRHPRGTSPPDVSIPFLTA